MHFDGQAEGADQGGVQALVAVGLGDGDVVFDVAGLGLIEAVQRAEGGVAGGDVVDDDAEAVNVHHLGKTQFFVLHFLVDAVEVFFAAADFGFDVGAHQPLAEGAQYFAHHVATVAAAGLAGAIEHGVAVGQQVFEGEVLQLAVGMVEADAVGELGVDFQRFAGDALAAVGLFGIQRAHVVQAVGELDDDDADVFGHRHDELAEALGLMLGLAVVFEFFQLGEAVHHVGNGLAEFGGELFFARAGVFKHVVQHAGAQALGVDMPFGQLLGHGHGVGDVGHAAVAELVLVGADAEIAGAVEQVLVFGFQVACGAQQGLAAAFDDEVVYLVDLPTALGKLGFLAGFGICVDMGGDFGAHFAERGLQKGGGGLCAEVFHGNLHQHRAQGVYALFFFGQRGGEVEGAFEPLGLPLPGGGVVNVNAGSFEQGPAFHFFQVACLGKQVLAPGGNGGGIIGAGGNHGYLLRERISSPIWPAAISRRAVTVGLLLRMSSTSGLEPLASWRAR